MKNINKKVIIIAGIVIIVIALFSTLMILLSGTKDARKFKEEYESINDKDNGKGNKYRKVNIPRSNPIKYQTAKDIVKRVDNKETFIVYFGFKECPWCRSVIEQLIKVAQDKKIDTIYYVDIKDIRNTKEIDSEGHVTTTKEGDKNYIVLLEKFHDVLSDYILQMGDEKVYDGEKRIYAPNVIAVSKGKAIQMETGIPEDLQDPYSDLTKEMKDYTYEKFKCLMKCIEEEKTTCKKDMC